MYVHPCEVDGCSIQSRWERVSKADADLHKFLCGEHWKALHQHNWIAASAYRPFAAMSDTFLAEESSYDSTTEAL